MRSFLPFLVAASMTMAPAFATTDPLDRAIADPGRHPPFVARDGARHPREVLTFLGIRPDATVVELWPAGGYWTEMLGPYLHANGTYYAALESPTAQDPASAVAALPARLRGKIAARPEGFGHVHFTQLAASRHEIAPDGSADLVLTFRNLHNWMSDGETATVLAAVHRALKPGGIFGVEDHRASPDRPQDPKADDGYVRQDYAIAEIERAGFRLVDTSEIERNPRDTTHWPKGVWTLPPTYALGDVDHAKYESIGEADNFLLKFRKVDR